MFSESCEDLTTHLPDGASSVIMREGTTVWQVFTEVQYEGATVKLQPGKQYENLEEMGLQEPVKSFRRAPYKMFDF